VVIAVTIRKLVLSAMVVVAIGGCAGSGNSASDAVSNAKAYVRAIGPDAAQVQTYEIKVGLDILHNDPTGLAQDAQSAHDTFVDVKTDIIGAGNNVSDNDRLGNAELQMDDAINELKNGMGAVVAFAENPNGGTLGAANSKLDQGITDWDQAATVLWTMAGEASEVPTLAGSGPATTTPSGATTSPVASPTTSTAASAPGGGTASTTTTTCPAGERLASDGSCYGPCPSSVGYQSVNDPSSCCPQRGMTVEHGHCYGPTTPTSALAPPPPSNLPPTFTPALWSNDANFTCTEGALAVTQSTITDDDVFYCASTDNISHVLCWESGVSATSGDQTLSYDIKPGPQPMCPGAQP
jgi:hypothetical protein